MYLCVVQCCADVELYYVVFVFKKYHIAYIAPL